MRQQPWQQESAARGGRSSSKARRWLLLTRALVLKLEIIRIQILNNHNDTIC